MKEEYPKAYLYKQIVQAKRFIDTYFAEKIQIENIADQAHFSKFHFLRLFKGIYGKTPHQYLTQVRLEKAKEHLSNGVPVEECCYAVGFESITTFVGLFKKYEQHTPGEFKQKCKSSREEMALEPLRFVPNCFAEYKGWTKLSNIQEEG